MSTSSAASGPLPLKGEGFWRVCRLYDGNTVLSGKDRFAVFDQPGGGRKVFVSHHINVDMPYLILKECTAEINASFGNIGSRLRINGQHDVFVKRKALSDSRTDHHRFCNGRNCLTISAAFSI